MTTISALHAKLSGVRDMPLSGETLSEEQPAALVRQALTDVGFGTLTRSTTGRFQARLQYGASVDCSKISRRARI